MKVAEGQIEAYGQGKSDNIKKTSNLHSLDKIQTSLDNLDQKSGPHVFIWAGWSQHPEFASLSLCDNRKLLKDSLEVHRQVE